MRAPTLFTLLLFIPAVFLMVLPGCSKSSSSSSPKTLVVGSSYLTIQGAIDAAAGGDTILVPPGTYFENLNFRGKAITLRSDLDSDSATHDIAPETTIIDGILGESVVRFMNQEGRSSVLEGFTLTHGSGTLAPAPFDDYCGGAIFCLEATPTLKNNILVDNTVSGYGGGVFCWIRFLPVSPILEGNLFANNQAEYGAGITSSVPTLFRMINNRFTGNVASKKGGAIYAGGPWDLVNGLMDANQAAEGGAIATSGDTTVATLRNCTIFNNQATEEGGALFSSADNIVTNSIFWNNSAVSGPEMYLQKIGVRGKLDISYSLVQGSQGSVEVDASPQYLFYWDGASMLDSDPLFVSGHFGDFYLSQVSDGQLFNSPCLDMGKDSSFNEGLDTYWTRTDGTLDQGLVDIGFHYGTFSRQ